ncbi:MAG: DUF4435 domain-containing protein [Bacteroidaceae bacterium]|nr:DUF4435 domain-containing protein [Bacteroidaceae bacterium]
MKSLTSNLTSKYLEAAQQLRKSKKKKVIAYVESYDDIFFWRSILSEYETPNLSFEVMLPSKVDLSRGKKTAMMNKLGENLGACMIACVDADVDYLMQRATNNSRLMLDNPYVVHTYAYAIENLQCYAPSLHNVCVMATLNDRDIFDFEAYLKAYSEIVYDLFVWAIWLYRELRFSEFPLTTLCNFISVEHLNIYNPAPALEKLRKMVNKKMAWMQQKYPEARGKLKPLKEELSRLGLRPDNTYLFIQGHHIMDNVVSEALEPVCTVLRREREKEIKRLAAGHTQQMDNELACYQHSQFSAVQMIRRNTLFKSSEVYKMIQAHIERILSKIN